MKLSLVIPVYNVENYIDRCLQSCLNQNIPKNDYEIILINDGSTDGSLNILKNYKEDNKNIKIINQNNGGPGSARNRGIREAQGEYIWFIDSDDWIEGNCLKDIIKELEDIDLLMLNIQQVFPNIKEIIPLIQTSKYNIQSGKDILKRKEKFFVGPPYNIYRKDFLIKNNLEFIPGIYHEDLEFKPKVIYYADKIKYYKPIVYNNLKERSNSITNKFRLKNGIDYIKVAKSLDDFSKIIIKESNIQKTFSYYISTALNSVLWGMQYLSIEEKEVVLKLIKENRNLLKHFWNSSYPNYMIEYLFLRLNTNLGIKFYNKSKTILRF